MPDPNEQHEQHNNILLTANARAATLGVDYNQVGETGGPVVVVTKADLANYYDGPLPHSHVLDVPNHPDLPKLEKALADMAAGVSSDPETIKAFHNPDVLFALLNDKASAAPQSGGSSVCVLVVPEQSLTLRQHFHLLAHLPPSARPELGLMGDKKDPGVLSAHELEHCNQSPISSVSEQAKPDMLLHHEHGADRSASVQFPQEARLVADARALGAVHVGLRDGSNQHATALVEALGGQISYPQVESTYREIAQEISRRHVDALLKTDTQQLRGHLVFALKKEAEALGNESGASLTELRQSLIDAKQSPAEVLQAIPESSRSGVEERLASLVGLNMNIDPSQIAPLLRAAQSGWHQDGRHDHASTTDPVSVASRLYLEAADRAFPQKVEKEPPQKPHPTKHRRAGPAF